MGAFTSSHTQIANDETHASESTPRPPPPHHRRNKRILSIDPRSPSENIMRTPIIVDKTPAPSDTPKCETVSSSGFLRDPRSPTTDFTRTPLGVGNPHYMSPGLDLDASITMSMPSASGTPVSHHSLTSESGIESADVTPIFKKAGNDENVACQSPDSAVNSETAFPAVAPDDMDESGCSDTPCLDDDQGLASSGPRDDAPLLTKDIQNISISKSSETVTFLQMKNTPENQLKQRNFLFGKKVEALATDSKSVRSPLAFVDNSPRYGRLQKSSTKTVTVTSSRGVQAGKENVCH